MHNTSSPRFVVLMATFNGEKWINDQIETILSQTDVSVDLYISDDGSQDNTLKIIKKLQKK